MAYTTINKSTDYFNTKLYTGNGSYGHSITGVGFQPDFVWIKGRSNADNHNLYDAVRGTDKALRSNTTDAELSSVNLLHSFNSDGFTVDDHTPINRSGGTIASWNWKANGAGSSNSNGSITSTVSANTTAGFSIVSYTGTGANATVGHGLGVAPSMYIVKNRDDNDSWGVYHKSLGATKYLRLQGTDAAATSSVWWNDTEPTSSVFSVGTAVATNASAENLIAYCFAEKTGYSKFGSYTGNGNADGTFIYTGFKPAWVLTKRITNLSWRLYDAVRDIDNVVQKELYPNNSDAEVTTDRMDFLSNGFKIRSNSTNINENGTTFIYMAFGQSLVGSNNVPCTAR